MGKKDKPIRAKLIANPGAGNALESAARLEQVIHYLLENGLKVDVALAHCGLKGEIRNYPGRD